MRIATLFSGIGAPEQGAKRVYKDINTVFACEFDKYARQSYEANYDIDLNHFHKDVNDLDATQYKNKVDIVIGGSPCQAFSVAGMRHGTKDERGQLIYQYIRVIEECMPPIIVYENVKGMLSIGGGNTIKEFVQALRDIGYHCHYGVVNTKNYGVPQNRERLFLVGFLDHELYHKFNFAYPVTLKTRVKDILEKDVEESFYLRKKIDSYLQDKTIAENRTDGMRFFKDDCCGALRTIDACGDKIVIEPKINTNRIRKLTPRECFRLQDFSDDFKFVVSNSQLYKQVGNSMSVNILEMIFKQIEKAKQGETMGLF